MLFIYSLKNEDFLRTIHITKVKENTFYQHLLKNEMLTQDCCLTKIQNYIQTNIYLHVIMLNNFNACCFLKYIWKQNKIL